MFDRGVGKHRELHYIQQQLGHHSPAFTLAVYAHLAPRDRRSEANCLDEPAAGPGRSTCTEAISGS